MDVDVALWSDHASHQPSLSLQGCCISPSIITWQRHSFTIKYVWNKLLNWFCSVFSICELSTCCANSVVHAGGGGDNVIVAVEEDSHVHVAVPTFAIISSILGDKRSMMSCNSLLKRNSLFGIVSYQNKCSINYLWVGGITLTCLTKL
jgi:hypothetical protein